jgi:hypothetical protein
VAGSIKYSNAAFLSSKCHTPHIPLCVCVCVCVCVQYSNIKKITFDFNYSNLAKKTGSIYSVQVEEYYVNFGFPHTITRNSNVGS